MIVMDSGQTWRQQVVMLQYPMLCLCLQVLDAVLGVERMHLQARRRIQGAADR